MTSCSPWADPNQIRLSFEGAEELRTDEEGGLILKVAGRGCAGASPWYIRSMACAGDCRAYRAGGEGRILSPTVHPVASLCFFELAAYDRRLPLVIDRLVYWRFMTALAKTGLALSEQIQGNVYPG